MINTIIKTITKRDRSGLSLYKVESLQSVDLSGLALTKHTTWKDHDIYIYENTLLDNHKVKVEIIQARLSQHLIKHVNLIEDVMKLRDKIKHGKAGWTTLGSNLDSIIKKEPWI